MALATLMIAAFVGTGSSFLAFATIAAKREMAADAYPSKGIYYLGGLTEGAETIAVFVAMCVFPALFPILAYGFAAACAVTTITRWLQGWVALAPGKITKRRVTDSKAKGPLPGAPAE